MNANQAENLRVLIRHMDGLERTLNMTRYFEPCGTPACAMGEAYSIAVLRDAGLRKFTEQLAGMVDQQVSAWVDGAHKVFGVTNEDGIRLFGVYLNGRTRVTPQEWAIEARKVLAEHGYSMDTDKAAADAFINRIRKWEPERIGKDTIRFDMRDRV